MFASAEDVARMEFSLGEWKPGRKTVTPEMQSIAMAYHYSHLPPVTVPVAPRKFSFGGAGRPGEYQAYLAQRDASASDLANQFRSQYLQYEDPIQSGFTPKLQQVARSRTPREADPQAQQWLGPEPSEGRMAREISQREANRIIAALSGTEDSGSILSSKWLWIGVAVLAGVCLMSRSRS